MRNKSFLFIHILFLELFISLFGSTFPSGIIFFLPEKHSLMFLIVQIGWRSLSLFSHRFQGSPVQISGTFSQVFWHANYSHLGPFHPNLCLLHSVRLQFGFLLLAQQFRNYLQAESLGNHRTSFISFLSGSTCLCCLLSNV